jgi:sedoheptulokinase
MEKKNILSLDIGTSKISVLAIDVHSQEILADHSLPTPAVANEAPDIFEQDPAGILNACFILIRKVLASAPMAQDDIAAICVTGQMHGILLIDSHLNPQTNLITWQDERVLRHSTGGIHELYDKIPDTVALENCGCYLRPGYGGPTLYWLSQHNRIAPGSKVVSIADYVTACLTGEIVTEPTHAASWGLYSLVTRAWHHELIDRMGLDHRILPRIATTGECIGVLRKGTGEELGLRTPVKVTSTLGDNQASIIGATGFSNDVVLNMGTGGQISIPLSEFRHVAGFEVRPMPFDAWVCVGSTLCAGHSYACLKNFVKDILSQIGGIELEDAIIYERLNASAKAALGMDSGLRVTTQLSGTRLNSQLRGTIGEIDTKNLTIGNLACEFCRGIAQELHGMIPSTLIDHMNRIILSGNLPRKNPLMRDLVEMVFGVPCRLATIREEAAWGAALVAAAGLGLLPRPAYPNL